MYRAKNKIAFFAIHQALNRLQEFDLEFHIVWDDPLYKDEWTDKIACLDCKVVDYTKEDLDEYCRIQGVEESRIESFKKFKSVYFVVHGHLLKTRGVCDYYLIYDDDIVLSEDLEEFKACLKEEVPCLISEPMNASCDKSMMNSLMNLYGGQEAFNYYVNVNPNMMGFNAGIQGVSLDMYEDFQEPSHFQFLLDLFDYSGIYDENGKEITGPKRSMIDTQQQSFFGIMNIIRSKKTPVILDPSKYFVCPNWGTHPIYGDINTSNEYNGWDVNMKSKIIHFIGHTVFDGKYYGKPKQYHDLVDMYLKKHNII